MGNCCDANYIDRCIFCKCKNPLNMFGQINPDQLDGNFHLFKRINLLTSLSCTMVINVDLLCKYIPYSTDFEPFSICTKCMILNGESNLIFELHGTRHCIYCGNIWNTKRKFLKKEFFSSNHCDKDNWEYIDKNLEIVRKLWKMADLSYWDLDRSKIWKLKYWICHWHTSRGLIKDELIKTLPTISNDILNIVTEYSMIPKSFLKINR